MAKDVVVVIGVGGMGLAVARRSGSGRTVLLADADRLGLDAAATTLRDEGHEVLAHPLDVSDPAGVSALARAAAESGPVARVVHTAGLSPVQASTSDILAVDLLGVALVLDAFGEVVASGGAGVVIASMAAHLIPALPVDHEHALAVTPAAELLDLAFVAPDVVGDPGSAYALAKRANQLRVQAAAVTWGRRGARVNSISPGVIATPMGHQELAGEVGQVMRELIDRSPTGRLGTPDDIAAAAAFLLEPQSSFVTGTDLLVDGGAVAAVHWPPPTG